MLTISMAMLRSRKAGLCGINSNFLFYWRRNCKRICFPKKERHLPEAELPWYQAPD